jgi:hypothetical protein
VGPVIVERLVATMWAKGTVKGGGYDGGYQERAGRLRQCGDSEAVGDHKQHQDRCCRHDSTDATPARPGQGEDGQRVGLEKSVRATLLARIR